MKGLTQRQKEVVAFIENYIDKNCFAPSVRDVADHFGFSPKAAFDHLTALRKKGIITTAENLPRSVVVKKDSAKESIIYKVPIVGATAAGTPILSEESYDGYVNIPSSLLGLHESENLYALRVKGDSMIDDGINDGDLAIMFKTKVANNGDIVAASIGTEQEYGITLKHFFKVGERYELRPANKAYQSIISTECDVHGKLLMIIRKY